MKRRIFAALLALVMTLSLLPMNVLAAEPETDGSSGMNFTKQLVSNGPDADGNYTIQMTAQATGKTTTKVEPMDIVLVLDQSGSMKEKFDKGTRQSAMKAAVNTFIGKVANKYSEEADHRMAIVTFDTDAKTLVNWTAVGNGGKSTLTGAISSLPTSPSGATNVGAGMQLAQSLMNSDAYTGSNAERQKTVIVFTDGVPTTTSDFDTDVANIAISAAKSMKGSGVTIYTVGIFNGTEPDQLHGDAVKTLAYGDYLCTGAKDEIWGSTGLGRLFREGNDFDNTDIPAGNRFLNYLSSNFKSASTIGLKRGSFDKEEVQGYKDRLWDISWTQKVDGYKITNNFERNASDYYLTADSASKLEGAFKTISNTVPEPDRKELNGDTVITDTLSDYFTFAGTKDGDVKVYTEKPDGTTSPITEGIDVNGKIVTVTGYDFSQHYKGIGGDAEETLVIEIKVKPSGEGYSEKEIPTNKGNATVTLGTKGIDKAEPPTVDGYSVTYALNEGSWSNGTTAPETLYYPQGTDVAVTNKVPTRDGYEFTSWTPSTDDDTVTAPEISNSKFTMPAANVTLTAQWKESKYTVTYELTGGNWATATDVVSPADYAANDTVPVTKNIPVKEGYTFADWTVTVDPATATAPTITEGKLTMPAANVTLTAQWTPNKYTVTYTDGVENEEVFKDVVRDNVAYGSKIPAYNTTDASKTPTRDGYTFNGWKWYSVIGSQVAEIATGKPETMPANDLKAVAQWAINSYNYTVEYYIDGKKDDKLTAGPTLAEFKSTISDYTKKCPDGYKLEKTENLPLTIGTGENVICIYYTKRTDLSYTVKYVDKITGSEIQESTVKDGKTFGDQVTGESEKVTIANYTYVEANPDPLTISTDASKNVITLYYTKNAPTPGTFDFNDIDDIDGKETPAITKTVKGNVGKNFKETFAVTVKGTDTKSKDTMSAPDYTGKAEVAASKSLKDVPFLFKPEVVVNASVPYGRLLFTEAGTYTYTVQEVKGKPGRMSYDTTEYTLTIKVVLNKEANKYEVESCQFSAGGKTYDGQLNIVNTYRAYHPSTPSSKPTLNTGDHYAYVMGYPDGTVRPNGSITRAEVSTILFRLLSDKTREEYFTTESSFTDVKAGAWYNNSIATLEKAGVIVDTAKGGAFRPDEAITRAELAAMLAQFADAKPVKGVKFSDVSADHWAYDAIAIAAKMGWIEGYPDGTFRPDATITRAEMMTLVNRALERVPSDEDHLLSKRVMLTFPDCKSSDWFYIAVQEATNSHAYERAATEKNGDEQWTALRDNRDWTKLEY